MARLAHSARLSGHLVALVHHARTGCTALLPFSHPNSRYAGVSVFRALAQTQTTPKQVLHETVSKQVLT